MKVLIISDIHGNYDALRAVLEDAGSWDQLWVLGDLVDYGPEPEKIVDEIRDMRPEVLLRGNHDHAAAYNVDCGCGIRTHDISVYTREHITRKLLSEDQLEWLKNLDLKIERSFSGGKIILVHGSPRSPLYDYMLPSLPKNILMEMIGSIADEPSRSLVIFGHTHLGTNMLLKNSVLLNPGSVGQPRDGDPRASYAIFDLESMDFRIIRVKYEVEKVVGKLRELVKDGAVMKKLSSIYMNGRV
ncbi:MAG: metallophosphoesterase family protein [Fervidicoccaceae archaeon]